jgi:hypothetical protein
LAQLFGFEISRISDKEKEKLVSFVPKQEDDGATTIQAGGVYGTYVDLDGSIKNEAELVTKYRDAAQQPEMDMAIDNVINDAIVQEDDKPIVELVLDDVKVTANIKKLILDEFQNILNLLEFNQYAYEIFRRWYIDGRLYYHVIVDKDNVADGIKELRYVDSRKMRKVVETRKRKVNTNVSVTETSSEYYIYSDRGFKGKSSGYGGGNTTQGNTLRIAKDSIVFVSSGLTNTEGDMILSYLHKALKVLNQLRALEDSLIIYRISRAPERRVFYIDVGNLPKAKAEQYVQSVMANFKNKLVYDSATGEIRDDRKFMTMLEDFWLPRREGGRGTEITTLPGGQNLSQIDDIEYFQQNLYKALNVPISRLQPESTFSFGRATEISRDEVKFSKFITRLRGKFSVLFLKLLETQLILKNIITSEDWEEFKHQIRFKFATDNYFDELKETEVLRDRIAMLRDVDDYAGKYYSHSWIRRTVLRQTEEEIDEIDKEIKEELDNEQYNPPADMSGEPDGGAPENPGVGDGGDSGGSGSDSNEPGNQQIDLSSEPPQILGKLANRQDAIGLAAKQEIASRRSGTKS